MSGLYTMNMVQADGSLGTPTVYHSPPPALSVGSPLTALLR
jgi:hypothetical protein